jgi:hypothetical protein
MMLVLPGPAKKATASVIETITSRAFSVDGEIVGQAPLLVAAHAID